MNETKEELFCIEGTGYHSDSFAALARDNPDWELPPEEILKSGRAAEEIPHFLYTDRPVELIKESEAAIRVQVARKTIGYIKPEDCAHVSQIRETHKITAMRGVLFGGPVKAVCNDGTVIQQDVHNKARIIIEYSLAEKAEATAARAVSNAENEDGMRKGCLGIGLGAVGLLVLLILFAVFGGKGKPDGQLLPTPTPMQASAQAEATPSPALSGAALPIDDVMARIEEQASQSFEKVKVFLHENIVVVQVWESGMANTSYLALESDDLKDQWAKMAESMRQTSEQTKVAIDSSGNTDYHIAYYLMNDENDENMLIGTLDDLLTYDAVSGLDRLNVAGR